MRLWLDDVRPMPEDFDYWAKNATEAMIKIVSGEISHVSLDHDLGDFGGTGYEVAKAIEYWAYHKTIRPLTWEIHSANPVGRKNIEQAMRSAERFWNA